MFLCRLLLAVVALGSIATSSLAQPTARDQFGDPLPNGALTRLGTVRWRHDGVASFAAFLPGGRTVITVGADQTIRVWEFPSGKELERWNAAPNSSKGGIIYGSSNAGPVALSKDGKIIATCPNGLEIRLWDIATGKEMRSLAPGAGKSVGRPSNIVTAIAFSPDGQNLAAAEAGPVRIWDVAAGKESRQLGGGGVNGILFDEFGDSALLYAPDGKCLATIRLELNNQNQQIVGVITLWDPATGNEIRSFRKDTEIVSSSVAFSPDAKNLAYSTYDGEIAVVDTGTGRELVKVANGMTASNLVFSKDGSKIYARLMNRGSIQELSVATGKLVRELGGGQVGPNGVGIMYYGGSAGGTSLSPDGNLLVVAGSGNAPLFIDLISGKYIATTVGHTTPVLSLRFAADGRSLLTQGSDFSVKKWDAATGRQISVLEQHGSSTGTAVSPDGKIAARLLFGVNGGLAFFDSASGKEIARTPLQVTGAYEAMCFSPDSKMLAIRQRQQERIDLFEVPSAKLLHSIGISTTTLKQAKKGGVAKVAKANVPQTLIFSPDGKTLAAHFDLTTFGLWNTTTGQRIAALPLASPSQVQSGAFSPDGRSMALEMNDGTVHLFETATGQLRRAYGKAPTPAKKTGSTVSLISSNAAQAGPRVAFSPNSNSLVLAGTDRVIRMWHISTGAELAALEGHNGAINAVAFAPGGATLASASADTTALVWDVAKVARMPPPAKQVSREELDACWEALIGDDGAKSFAAICDMIDAGNGTVDLLKEHVKPSAAVEPKRIQDLIGLLEDVQYKVRQRASADLLQIGEQIVPIINDVLAKSPPPETRNRLVELRTKLTSLVLQGERLRQYRAVEALEHIGTPESRRLLQALADGAPGTLLTISAEAALKR